MLQNALGRFTGFGFVGISARASRVLSRDELRDAFRRSIRGLKRYGEFKRLKGCRLLITGCSCDGVKFWIIIEADRSRSLVMMPGEPLNCRREIDEDCLKAQFL